MHDDVRRAHLLEVALRDFGHEVSTQTNQHEDLLVSVRRSQPDTIIVVVEPPQHDTIRELSFSHEPTTDRTVDKGVHSAGAASS